MEIKGLKDLLEMYNNTCELKKKAERRLKKFTERLSEEDKKNLGAIDEMNLLRLQIKDERRKAQEDIVRPSYIKL